MIKLKVSQSKRCFELNGKPFFYLADTVWSAFTNITIEEWEYYLTLRKMQGFNVLQINTLPQWDRCMSDTGVYPFATEDGQVFDFTKWNPIYYENAGKMCQMAIDMEFQLALVVLWVNYIPDTWGSRLNADNIMSRQFIREYTEKVVDEFDKYNPIYIISGDTDFEQQETIACYAEALQIICERSPASLKTMHVKRAYDEIPKEFVEKLDFYMFQSGHNCDGQKMTYILPEKFREKYPKKPIVNAEPCYENMGYSHCLYGRYQVQDIRRAAWDSILSGACAGVTYGAHGIWNWQKVNKKKNPVSGEAFDSSCPWQEAIQFPGAWDYGWIRQCLQIFGIRNLTPTNELLENETEEIRVAVTEDDRYLIYMPYGSRIILKKEFEKYTAKAVDMKTKRIALLKTEVKKGMTIVEMHPFCHDVLLVLEKTE